VACAVVCCRGDARSGELRQQMSLAGVPGCNLLNPKKGGRYMWRIGDPSSAQFSKPTFGTAVRRPLMEDPPRCKRWCVQSAKHLGRSHGRIRSACLREWFLAWLVLLPLFFFFSWCLPDFVRSYVLICLFLFVLRFFFLLCSAFLVFFFCFWFLCFFFSFFFLFFFFCFFLCFLFVFVLRV